MFEKTKEWYKNHKETVDTVIYVGVGATIVVGTGFVLGKVCKDMLSTAPEEMKKLTSIESAEKFLSITENAKRPLEALDWSDRHIEFWDYNVTDDLTLASLGEYGKMIAESIQKGADGPVGIPLNSKVQIMFNVYDVK